MLALKKIPRQFQEIIEFLAKQQAKKRLDRQFEFSKGEPICKF
jgi:hypothetical protein